MIYFIIGTKAQLIKMAPIMRCLADQNIPYRYISTGQHRETMADILDNFSLRKADYQMYTGPDVVSISSMLLWSIKIIIKTILKKKEIFEGGESGIVLVHGDTFSTLIGAIMGRIAKLKVGHVESGLRSFNIFHPFPEEITRLMVFRLAHVMFCPGAWAVQNLIKYPGEKINTQANTLIDALSVARAIPQSKNLKIPDYSYGIVSLHRFENIHRKSSLLRVVEVVEYIAAQHKLIFILHKPTENKLEKHELYERLKSNPNVEFRPRYDYFNFIQLLSAAKFAVSDGGSNQEECSYLGKPLLLLRKATERTEGLSRNCVLSMYDLNIVQNFLDEMESYEASSESLALSPSRVIVESLSPYCSAQ